jgi:hypothetical protein
MTARKTKAKPMAETQHAYVVSGEGTDEDIAARCAESIPGWGEMGKSVQQETVRLMRVFWSYRPSPVYETKQIGDKRMLGVPDGHNVTLQSLRTVEAMGTNSTAYSDQRLAELARHYKGSDSGITAGLAFITGAKAEDPVQSALATQMVATHDAAMKALSRSTNAEYVEQAQVFGNLAAKLLNAYTRQAETMAKLQRGGEQIIKHVHIDNRGGQAVVTDRIVTGGRHEESGHQPYAFGPALLRQDPARNGVPITSDQGQEAVQASWGSVHGRA